MVVSGMPAIDVCEKLPATQALGHSESRFIGTWQSPTFRRGVDCRVVALLAMARRVGQACALRGISNKAIGYPENSHRHLCWSSSILRCLYRTDMVYSFLKFEVSSFDLEFCFMETSELKSAIAELSARVVKIRDWL